MYVTNRNGYYYIVSGSRAVGPFASSSAAYSTLWELERNRSDIDGFSGAIDLATDIAGLAATISGLSSDSSDSFSGGGGDFGGGGASGDW